MNTLCIHRRPWLTAALLAATLTVAVRAEEKPKAVVAGHTLTDTATLLRREAFGKPWEIVKEKEDLPAEQLILGLPRAKLESKNGAVKLIF